MQVTKYDNIVVCNILLISLYIKTVFKVGKDILNVEYEFK